LFDASDDVFGESKNRAFAVPSELRSVEQTNLATNGLLAILCYFGLFLVPTTRGQTSQSSLALETKASGVKTFYTDNRAGNNQVTFFSESTLEDFTGVCNRVDGQCTFDPKWIESFKGRFSIRVEDLKTGIELRDDHMLRPEWLNSAKHPEIAVQIDKVEEISKISPNTASLLLVGTCSIRGVSKNVRIPAQITYLDETPETMRRVKGDLLRIRAGFDVLLKDYGIVGPSGSDFIGLKVAETVNVKITVFGSTERPADPLKADRPEESAPRVPVAPPERPRSQPSSGP